MESNVSTLANIHPSAKIGKSCTIDAHVSIEENCIIGDNCHIQSFTHIYYNTVIGNRVTIGPHSNIGVDGFGYAQNKKGESIFTPQIGNVIIEDDVQIGSHCSIDRSAFQSTFVGKNSIIGGHSHIAHNLVIGTDCIIGPGFMVAGSTKMGDRVELGHRTNCVGHISICSDFKCKPMVLLNNNITKAGHYAGLLLKEEAEWKEIRSSILDIHNWNIGTEKEGKLD